MMSEHCCDNAFCPCKDKADRPSGGATPASEPHKLPTIKEMSGSVDGDLLDYESCGLTRPNTAERAAIETAAPSAPEPTPEQIAEKWATHPKLVVQCNLCNKDYAPAIAFEKCINTARFTPHPWKEKTILLPRKEAITAAIREALASSSVRVKHAQHIADVMNAEMTRYVQLYDTAEARLELVTTALENNLALGPAAMAALLVQLKKEGGE